MLSEIEIKRGFKIVDEVINILNLDLTGVTVLTEVGSSAFLFTPVIAALANAKHVYAWTRDSSYGKGDDIVRSCKELLKSRNLSTKVEFAINQRPAEHVKNADIVTNSGFVRPLNAELLKHAKSTVVIPIMYEAWELRSSDIDVDFCKEKKIKVGGTWENHPSLKIFDYCGPLALKMAFEAGYEVFQNKIILWSDDHFGDVIEKAFIANGASFVLKTTDAEMVKRNIKDIDFIFFADYSEQENLLADNQKLSIKELLKLNSTVGIVHLYGSIDFPTLQDKKVNTYPRKQGKPSNMTFTLSHVGLVPGLKLITAGFKVGEILYKNIQHPISQPLLEHDLSSGSTDFKSNY